MENAKITSVSLSMSDHGCLVFWLTLSGSSWGCNFGGYCIGHGYLDADDDFFDATSDGLVAIMKIMDVVGVEKWEDLPGNYVRVKNNALGRPITCIGNIIKDKWFDAEEFFSKNEETGKNHDGWISVKDKLPDTDGYYLVTEKHSYGDSSINIVHFTKDLKSIDEFDFYGKSGEGWYVFDGEYGYVEIDNIIAWQTLPEPYKEGGAEE